MFKDDSDSNAAGMDRVQVNMTNIFACGQAYVALSRARTQEGLQVLNFKEGSVRVDEEVKRWNRNLMAKLEGQAR